MLENLTKFISKNTAELDARSSTSLQTLPAGWRSIDPQDHMGSIMNQTGVKQSVHEKLPLHSEAIPEVVE
jgi:hypothetical protein